MAKATTKAATKRSTPTKKAGTKSAGPKKTASKATVARPAAQKATRKTVARPAAKKASSKATAARPVAKKASSKATVARAATKKASSKTTVTKTGGRTTVTKAGSRTTVKKAATGKTTTATKANGLDPFLQEQMEALEAERLNYTHQAETLQAEADSLTEDREPGDVQFDEESGEGDTLAVERERDLALSAQARQAIEEIDVAVAKIHDGTYGLCTSCGKTIPKERLRALPHAALCVQCKSGGLGLRR